MDFDVNHDIHTVKYYIYWALGWRIILCVIETYQTFFSYSSINSIGIYV